MPDQLADSTFIVKIGKRISLASQTVRHLIGNAERLIKEFDYALNISRYEGIH